MGLPFATELVSTLYPHIVTSWARYIGLLKVRLGHLLLHIFLLHGLAFFVAEPVSNLRP